MLPPLEEASTSVDALVSDTTTDLPVRPGASVPSLGVKPFEQSPLFSESLNMTLSSANLSSAGPSDVSSTVKTQTQPSAASAIGSSPAIVPAVPVFPTSAAQLAMPPKKDLKSCQSPMPQQGTPNQSKSSVLNSKLPSNLGHIGDTSRLTSTALPKHQEKAGATDPMTSTAKVAMHKAPKAPDMETAVSTGNVKPGINQVDAKSQESLKRQQPRKLDIPAATDAFNKSQTVQSSVSKVNEMSAKNIHSAPAAMPSGPHLESTITQTASASSTRQQPRTIRVLPTPKTEVPPPVPVSAVPPTAASPAPTSKLLSRQPSLASINRPATPASELISDNASVTSTSVSRANSPPPTKVGTAPMRQVSKSQQKKERQARAKMEESKKTEEIVEKAVPDKPEQAPIIGRKKKTKKPAAINATASSTPAPSRPSSPAANESEDGAHELTKAASLTPAKDPKKDIKKDAVKAQDKKASETTTAPAPSTANDWSKVTSSSAGAIMAGLIASGEIDPNKTSIFKNLPGINQRFDTIPADFVDLDRKISFSDADRYELSQGRPVHLVPTTDRTASRMMITPGGAFLRGLTPEEEEHYLETEKRVAASSGLGKYNPRAPGTDGGFRTSYTFPELSGPHGKAVTDPTSLEGLDIISASHHNLLLAPNYLHPNNMSQGNKTGGGFEVDDFGGGQYPFGRAQPPSDSKPNMSIEEIEAAMLVARKESEVMEKKMNALVKKNRKLAGL